MTLRAEKGKVLLVDSSEQHDVKLELDRRIQDQIRKEISQVYREDGFLGEEGGEEASEGQHEWVVDPIDGTVNLFYGIPHYAVSIACRLNGQVLAGAIYDPNRDELFSTHRGGGADCNGTPMKVSNRERLDEAILALGFSKGKKTIEKCLQLYHFLWGQGPKTAGDGVGGLGFSLCRFGSAGCVYRAGGQYLGCGCGGLDGGGGGRGRVDGSIRASGENSPGGE